MALNEMAKEYHRKEVLDMVASRYIDELADKWLSLHEKIDNLYLQKSEIINCFQKKIEELEDFIDEQKKQISELESELAAKESLMNTMRCHIDGPGVGSTEALKKFGIDITADDEEPLPFSCDEYALFEELEDLRKRHQQDCITINQLQTTVDTLVDRYAKLRGMRGM